MIIPGLYEVSNLGRVRALNYSRTGRTEILKPGINKGYLCVYLYKDGKAKNFYVHRLVATMFIPNPQNLPEVNHIDENKQNDSVDNLEWSTRPKNVNHGTCQQRHAETIRGAKHPQARKVRCIETGQVFDCIEDALQWAGVKGGITKCCQGVYKQAGGYHWQYVQEDD